MAAVAPAKGKTFSPAATPPPPTPPVATAAAAAGAAAIAAASTTPVVSGRRALFAALTDALAGALGSVVAVAVFYPIDVAKTRAQASLSPTSPLPSSGHALENRDSDSKGGGGNGTAGGREAGWLRSRTLSALVSLVRQEGASRLYEGIEAKALQSLLGSFIYFYAYAFIKGAMRRRMQRGVGGAPGGGSKSLPPSLNLLAAALAGTMNQLFTLPLENITTRMQTAQRTPPSSAGDGGGSIPTPRKLLATRREQAFGGDLPGGADDVGEKKLPQVAIGRDFGLSEIVQPVKNLRGGTGNDVKDDIVGGEEIDRDRPGSNTSAAYAAASCLPGLEVQQQTGRQRRQSMLAVAAELYREGGGIARFWRGFVPSLVLTCNPAINYTAFDLLKALWLRRRAAVEAGAAATASAAAGVGASARGESSAPRVAAGSEGFLNPVEAFLVAAAAKSLATLITYPLIRAKVLLMTSSRSRPIPSSCLRPASRPSCRFPSAGAPSVAATGEETSPKRPPNASSPLAVRKEGAFKRDGDGDCQQGRDDSTTEDGGDGAFGARQQERARYSVGGNATDGSLSTATGESCVRNGSDAAAAAAGAARGGSGDGDVRGMGTVMLDIFHREGIGGLYTGCGAQLLHTILKSALLLATKEQIARAAASAVLLL